MAPPSSLRVILIVLMLAAAAGALAQPVPVVYEDEDLTVRASIPDIGRRPVHLGDPVSLVLQVEFDPTRVRVEALDSGFFERALAKQKGFVLQASPQLSEETRDRNHVTIRAAWPFLILDCPDEQPRCFGDKSYSLPVVSLAYQLIDASGEVLNKKAARFRIWPGVIPVTGAIAGSGNRAEEFSAIFPGGAYPAPLPVENLRVEYRVALIAGVLLLALGFRGDTSGRRPLRRSLRPGEPATRWERAVRGLDSPDLDDHQWADMLRRAATWYCVDELGGNPYAWLQDTAADTPPASAGTAAFREFFLDVLDQEGIAPERRRGYLQRFAGVVEAATGRPRVPESTA